MPITPTEKIWMNGDLVAWEDATVHVLTHTLHYGTGVFEGIRAYETSQGPAVFRWAVWEMSPVAQKALDAAGLTTADLGAFIPHQANQRITDAVASRLNAGADRVYSNIAKYGNTTAATLPMAFHEARVELTQGEGSVGDENGSDATVACSGLRGHGAAVLLVADLAQVQELRRPAGFVVLGWQHPNIEVGSVLDIGVVFEAQNERAVLLVDGRGAFGRVVDAVEGSRCHLHGFRHGGCGRCRGSCGGGRGALTGFGRRARGCGGGRRLRRRFLCGCCGERIGKGLVDRIVDKQLVGTERQECQNGHDDSSPDDGPAKALQSLHVVGLLHEFIESTVTLGLPVPDRGGVPRLFTIAMRPILASLSATPSGTLLVP